MLISFIIPTLNEEKYLPKCLEALRLIFIGRNKKEIIVVDGGSSDKTLKIAKNNKCIIVKNSHKTVGWARYLGFKRSGGKYIIFLDADCVLDEKWFLRLHLILGRSNVGGVGGSTVLPVNETSFGKAVDFVFSLSEIFTKTLHTCKKKLLIESHDLPGSNCMYKTEILKKVMPVALDVLTADDAILNYSIRQLGYKLFLNSEAKAYHYRRTSFKKLFIQMFRFAIGRLQVGKKHKELINFNHILSGFFIPISLLLLIILYKKLVIIGLLIFLFLIIQVIFYLIKSKSFIISFLTPFIIINIMLSWSLGFLRELIVPVKIEKTS